MLRRNVSISEFAAREHKFPPIPLARRYDVRGFITPLFFFSSSPSRSPPPAFPLRAPSLSLSLRAVFLFFPHSLPSPPPPSWPRWSAHAFQPPLSPPQALVGRPRARPARGCRHTSLNQTVSCPAIPRQRSERAETGYMTSFLPSVPLKLVQETNCDIF